MRKNNAKFVSGNAMFTTSGKVNNARTKNPKKVSKKYLPPEEYKRLEKLPEEIKNNDYINNPFKYLRKKIDFSDIFLAKIDSLSTIEKVAVGKIKQISTVISHELGNANDQDVLGIKQKYTTQINEVEDRMKKILSIKDSKEFHYQLMIWTKEKHLSIRKKKPFEKDSKLDDLCTLIINIEKDEEL